MFRIQVVERTENVGAGVGHRPVARTPNVELCLQPSSIFGWRKENLPNRRTLKRTYPIQACRTKKYEYQVFTFSIFSCHIRHFENPNRLFRQLYPSKYIKYLFHIFGISDVRGLSIRNVKVQSFDFCMNVRTCLFS